MSRLHRRVHYRRTFLNLPRHEQGAFAIADISMDRPRKDESEGPYVEAYLTLADCYNIVKIDCCVWSSSDAAVARNSLRKARLLQQVVTGFADALEGAIEEQAAIERELKAAGRRSRAKQQ